MRFDSPPGSIVSVKNSDPYRATAVYRRLLRYTRPYWKMFALALLCMVLFAATDVTVARLIKPLTDGSFIHHNPQTISWMPWAILGVFLLRGLAGFGSAYGMAWVGQNVVMTLRNQIFEHLLRVPVSHHDRNRIADLQTKLTYHASQIADAATGVLTSIVRDGLSAVGLLGLMFYTSWKLTLFSLLIAPVLSVSFTWVNHRFRTLSGRIQSSMEGITHSADEAITGRRMVKIYGGEPLVMRAFSRVNDYLRRQNIKLTAAGAASNGIMEMLAAVGVAALVFLATLPSMREAMTPGSFVSFIGAMLLMRQPLSAMTGLSQRLQKGLVAGGDLFRFLDTEVETDTGTRPLDETEGEIELRGVRYTYTEAKEIALDGIDLKIPAGKRVALVGKSGSGKTTLLSLIPRFYDPQEGVLLLDGHDLREYPLKELRRQIALVDQNIVLFNSSIADNIAYGIEPRPDEAKIIEAAKLSNAWVFIEKLTDGIHTQVGQDGLLLSGGERQRITIARALLKDAPILLLDEATSALDTESESLIQDALDRLVRGRTTLVIAHRLSTVQSADLIVVMDAGRIVERGTHSELLARDGAYAALHRLQFKDQQAPDAAA